MLSKPCCLRRAGDLRFARVKQNTLKEYRRALNRFVNWLDENEFIPNEARQWDDAACSSAAVESQSHGQMNTLIAALELFFPRFKHQFLSDQG